MIIFIGIKPKNDIKEPKSAHEISVLDISEDESALNYYADSFMKKNSLSAYKSGAKRTCMTQRKKRVKSKNLTHCRSIDLISCYDKSSIHNDEISSLNETVVKSKKKRMKMPDMLNVMHCQAKLIEEVLTNPNF